MRRFQNESRYSPAELPARANPLNSRRFLQKLIPSPQICTAELNGLGSWWLKAEKADIFILLDTVEFSDSSFTHRAKLPNGRSMGRSPTKSHWLTVPCKHPRLHKLIKDVEVDWRQYRMPHHVRTLQTIHIGRKQVEPYAAALQFMGSNHPAQIFKYLADLNQALILHLDAFHFKTPCKWMRASEIEADHVIPDDADYHLLLLLLIMGADTYLVGPSWSKYAPNLEKVLNEHGIKLEEIKQ